MNLYNNSITARSNKFIRNKLRSCFFKKKLKNNDWSLICNNCIGGLVTHDFGQQFRSPTVNLFFPGFTFFDFIEHLDYYLQCPVKNGGMNENPHYPIGILTGDETRPDIPVHFMHYNCFETAQKKWEERKNRINRDNIFVVWTFAFGDYTEEDYQRFNLLPVEKKIGFVNQKDLCDKYDSLYYIKGFDNEKSLGNILQFSNLLGNRYYDQFDFAKWFNE